MITKLDGTEQTEELGIKQNRTKVPLQLDSTSNTKNDQYQCQTHFNENSIYQSIRTNWSERNSVDPEPGVNYGLYCCHDSQISQTEPQVVNWKLVNLHKMLKSIFPR